MDDKQEIHRDNKNKKIKNKMYDNQKIHRDKKR